MRVDFLARKAYFLDHLLPVWDAMPAGLRGTFYMTEEVEDYFINRLARTIRLSDLTAYWDEGDCGHNPIVTAQYGDAIRAVEFDDTRPVALMEHGIGLTFGKPAYADGYGQRWKLALFMVPNAHTRDAAPKELQDKPHPIIGMPKLDRWAGEFGKRRSVPKKPTVAIAFHHGDKNSRPAEVGSAWEHYIDYLPELARQYKLLIHAHPIASSVLMEKYNLLQDQGVEYVDDFQEVMKRADIYLNDCSSTLYEFLVTGKPVVILNAPWFDKKANYGIRFWEYTDIGPQCEYPETLPMLIDQALTDPEGKFVMKRERAYRELFPHIGESAKLAVQAIEKMVQSARAIHPVAIEPAKPEPISTPRPKVAHRPARTSLERGIMYMCFGEAARHEIEKSIDSLRSTGSDLPITVVGQWEARDQIETIAHNLYQVTEWTGESPYDPDRALNFQFRAGRIKPGLYDLSPFKETMYVDCDVEFMADPEPGFGYLKHWDFVIAQERLAIEELYNRPRAGWQHNIEEKAATIKAFGGDGNCPFWNSGVFFFRKNQAVKELFGLWSKEWHEWQQWDEQLALMRAANCSRARVFVLSEIWNYPHTDNPKALIVHQYGRGAARTNVKE